MDQDSTKDGTGGGNRRSWRERLGVGQDLPKISDEFGSVDGNARPADESPPEPQAGPRPGAPVSRPAPMAPRYARPAAPQPGNGSSSGPDTQGPKPGAGSPGQKPWATPIRPAASHAPSPAPGSERPGLAPRANPAPQRLAPTRGPAAYAQAAARPGAASGHGSFGERLRAQRESAERLAQQRLAAARERSSQVRTDPLAILTPRKPDTTPPGRTEPRAEPPAHTKPAGAVQPRFTFAEEEIVAAQQETAFIPAMPPAAGGSDERKSHVGVQPGAPREPDPQPAPEDFVAAAPEPQPELRADYRHEDDGIFENEQPELHTAPARASAADYSAAYREFEDEFEEDEPRRGSGPLLLLLSLAVVAVVSGGLIYWYQQQASAPAPEARELPVISAPQEPVKAEPAPPPEPQLQQAAQPTTRKQIYDRIIGEETLEPESIVPTEEEPQLRQIQQRQQPLETPGTARQEGTSEPLPLPLPPPPGTGEQGDLLVPGMADTQTASASPEPAELTLPAPAEGRVSTPAPAETPSLEQASVVPAAGDPPSPGATGEPALRDTTAAEEMAAEETASASIYPELTEPLAYPAIVESPPQDQPAEPGEAAVADVPEPAAQVAAAAAATEAETATEPEVAQASDVPLPRAKPEPPVRTATARAPKAQPEAQPQSSGSGPMQILPSSIASGQAPAQSRAVQQPAAQPAPRQRTIGRDFDPLADQRSTFSSSPAVGPGAAVEQPAPSQQVASVAPDEATSQPQAAGGGYVVQLASFRNEPEAQSDYQRLMQRHPQLVSRLTPHILKASLGQSGSFYRLRIGPVADRAAATKLCNDLIAAGEKDCLVRQQ